MFLLGFTVETLSRFSSQDPPGSKFKLEDDGSDDDLSGDFCVVTDDTMATVVSPISLTITVALDYKWT